MNTSTPKKIDCLLKSFPAWCKLPAPFNDSYAHVAINYNTYGSKMLINKKI